MQIKQSEKIFIWVFMGLFTLALFLVYFINANKYKNRKKYFYTSDGFFVNGRKRLLES
ncbi:hypothetical protein M33023_01150 [Candidatus Phytoplasma asteris]|uniref:Uncharacterized protein n=1 Tax=Candidatus Phytoplasma asteris TaxID=85620 RepID=A0ABZ2YEH2_9MOLU